MLDRLLSGLALFALFIAGIGIALPSAAVAEFKPLTEPSTPVRLVVPSVGIKADVVPITLPADLVLDPPDDERLVGWWRGSRRPGAEDGKTVLTGHTVHTGGGVMDRLGDAVDGERVVVVTDKKKRVVYEIDSVETLSKQELADRSVELFAQDGGENSLVLITCTGWNGSEFEENIVVQATQLGIRNPAAATTKAAAQG